MTVMEEGSGPQEDSEGSMIKGKYPHLLIFLSSRGIEYLSRYS